MKLEKSKYIVTQEDIKKISNGVYLEPSNHTILKLIAEEEHLKTPYTSDKNISLLERNALRDIRFSIYSFGLLGLIAIGFGLYMLLYNDPRIAVNLLTKFPLIDNGSVSIVLGLVALLGSIYSQIKRESILISKVKSKIIQHFKKIQREKLSETIHTEPKRKKKVRHKPKKRRRK